MPTRLLLVLLAGMAPAASGQDAPRRPNVVLVMADDLGYRELGSYGQQRIRTPHLDRLAAAGVRLTSCYSGSPVCAPTRCVLMTGKDTGHAFVRDNLEQGGWGPDEPEGQLALPAAELTLAERLRALGYVTGAFGKWGLGGPDDEGQPNRQGFDRFFGYLCQRVAHNYYPTHLWSNHERAILPGNPWFSAHQKLTEPPADYGRYAGRVYAPERIADEALAFVDANRERPFFLYWASVIPHVALQVPDADVAAYPAEWDDTPYLGARGYLPHPRPRAAYAAMISFLDRQVGRLLAKLDEHGLAENTLVIFTSDNGTTYAGGVDYEFFASVGELRGLKGSLFEGGIRVPLLARWPGVIPAGRVDATPSGLVDVVPTVLAAVGGDAVDGLDGVDVLPVLRGAGPPTTRDHLYWEYRSARGQQAVRVGRWKGLRRGILDGKLAIELYDLDADASEEHDVAAAHPEIVAKIARIMNEERTPSAEFPLPAVDRLQPAAR